MGCNCGRARKTVVQRVRVKDPKPAKVSNTKKRPAGGRAEAKTYQGVHNG